MLALSVLGERGVRGQQVGRILEGDFGGRQAGRHGGDGAGLTLSPPQVGDCRLTAFRLPAVSPALVARSIAVDCRSSSWAAASAQLSIAVCNSVFTMNSRPKSSANPMNPSRKSVSRATVIMTAPCWR